jgi:acylphosphatase
MIPTAKHVIFKGRVQGVGFRYTTQQTAGRHDLTGYVRNLPDGTVEALLQGTSANVLACLAQIKDDFGGYIRDTKITDQPVDPQFHDFRIAY